MSKSEGYLDVQWISVVNVSEQLQVGVVVLLYLLQLPLDGTLSAKTCQGFFEKLGTFT